jgi:hypothetical protein
MRIKLKKGKQEELILKSKKDYTWRELSKQLNISENYLRCNLKFERVLINKKVYSKLCEISKTNFDKYIEEKLEDNWGQSKGGSKSVKSRTKKVFNPEESEDLAEIIGILLGDGNINEFKKGKKIRCYSLSIAGNMKTDEDYMMRYIPSLFERVFGEKGKLIFKKGKNVGYFKLYGKEYVEYFKSKGISSGNKKKNNQGIPFWIRKNKKFLKRCIRGLIDTDGSIHKISKNHKHLRIDYTSHISRLLGEVRDSLITLGFSPSKIINGRHLFITSKSNLEKYLREIGFGNKKNLNRVITLKYHAPMV